MRAGEDQGRQNAEGRYKSMDFANRNRAYYPSLIWCMGGPPNVQCLARIARQTLQDLDPYWVIGAHCKGTLIPETAGFCIEGGVV